MHAHIDFCHLTMVPVIGQRVRSSKPAIQYSLQVFRVHSCYANCCFIMLLLLKLALH